MCTWKCNSTSSGGPSKKPRVHHSSSQPSLKVRKEKLGDRITALHQIVSPFGKTDTASVLSEAIGYIRFIHSQIQVSLSSPSLSPYIYLFFKLR
nr:transcription factor bHLH68-like isoform X2 [Ipomoea batatas]